MLSIETLSIETLSNESLANERFPLSNGAFQKALLASLRLVSLFSVSVGLQW